MDSIVNTYIHTKYHNKSEREKCQTSVPMLEIKRVGRYLLLTSRVVPHPTKGTLMDTCVPFVTLFITQFGSVALLGTVM